jgi:class 3 adenylate cyclase
MVAGGIFSSSILVVIVVLLQVAVFLYYDSVVRRQDRLECSERIMNEIFPEAVRDRLSEQKLSESAEDSQPILDTYDETTVLFADIANFTKWSSGRDPRQVFELLERLFAKFDELALRHCVTKIETIGDCYMAVTGCPIADDKHALHMAKFANAMLQAANDTLIDEHGLQLRIGIHSGPVVAGVLRNHKARYQLFGDSVNVAARMESNGVAGRIQISQATADYLRTIGKGNWLQRRKDAVFAKGKGRLSTYWLVPNKKPVIADQEEEEEEKEKSICYQQLNKEQVVLVAPLPLRARSAALPHRSPRIPARNLLLTSASRARSDGHL